MYQSVRVRKVSTGSIFKLVFLGLACSLPLTFLVLSLLSLWGYGHVQVNGKASSWIASPVTGLILALFLSLFVGALMSLGLWIYARFGVLRLDLVLALNDADSRTEQSLQP